MAMLSRKRIFEIHEEVVDLCNTEDLEHEGFPVEFAKKIEAETLELAAKEADKWGDARKNRYGGAALRNYAIRLRELNLAA